MKKCHINKSWLYQKYWKERLSAQQIANFYGITKRTILNWMIRYSICRRTLSEARIGKILTEEHKRNIGIASKGKNNGMYSKHHTKETKRKMSENMIGRNSWNWQGGISFEPYGIEFNNELKEKIRKRDDYICQFCGAIQNGRKHTVHHIDYNKKDSRERNLITLCLSDNMKANFGRKKWELYYTILNEIRGGIKFFNTNS